MTLKPSQPRGWFQLVSVSGSLEMEGGVLSLASENICTMGCSLRNAAALKWFVVVSFCLAQRRRNCSVVTGKEFGMIIIAQGMPSFIWTETGLSCHVCRRTYVKETGLIRFNFIFTYHCP